MAKIEELQTCVPLYSIVEHLLGDPDASDAGQWDRALKELIAAIGGGKLKISGFRAGSEIWEEVPFKEFPEIANNPVSDFDFEVEFSGERVLEFDEVLKAIIVRKHKHFNEMPTKLWTDVCANSGAEVLRLWPPTPPPIEDPVLLRVQEALRDAIEKKGKPLTTREAEDIASGIVGQKKSREMLLTVQLPQKQGRRRKEPKRA
jgi:hypothetical protein